MSKFVISFFGRERNAIGAFYLIQATVSLPFLSAERAWDAFKDGDREIWMTLARWEVNHIEKIELI